MAKAARSRGQSRRLGDVEVQADPPDRSTTLEAENVNPNTEVRETTTSDCRTREKTPRLNIIVTGDAFHERYIWREVDTAAPSPLPYTWPDELRSSRATETMRELSGAPLHARASAH